MALDVIEKFFERECATGATDQATVKTDIHHLWRAFCPFAVEHVEIVFEIREEMLARVEALRRAEAHVVGIKRIGDDEMRALWTFNPIGKIIGIGVG